MKNYDKPKSVKSEYTFSVQSKLNVGSLLTVVAPKKDAGRKILMKKNNMWMYIPGNPRTIRLSQSEDFMGSTFSNSDLMDSDMEDDYKAEIVNSDKVPDSFILIRLKANNNKVTYARLDIYVRKDSYIPAIMQYYSKSGQLLKKMSMSRIKKLAGLNRPTYMVMESLFEPGKKTVVEILSLNVVKDMPDSMFNEAKLAD